MKKKIGNGLPSKSKALSSNASAIKKGKKER
jgi:hypothetical protein